MKLCNPLKSLTGNSILGRSTRRLRRRPRVSGRPWSAEVLEQRDLLAANVNLSVVAGAITMAATDGGNHGVAVHRVDPTNVEFDTSAGTQITYRSEEHTSELQS